jgi:hypothetical protein
MTPYDFCLPVNLVVLELKVGYNMCAFIGIFSSLFWGCQIESRSGENACGRRSVIQKYAQV